MRKHAMALGGAGLMLGVSLMAVQAQDLTGELPDPPAFAAQSEPVFVSISDILEYKALPEYHEPAWVTSKYVDAGTLPPVAERLPKEPMVYKTANMPDGTGVYGDTMRHVIGGRPEGWNYIGGQSQGWGGIDIGMSECLTRTGPLFEVKADELSPLPNLAKSWEWSEDGHELTMHLIEGAKWSDGEPFTSDDVMFYWNDNVLDSNVSPLNGATPETFGPGTTLEAVDDYTIKWTFQESRPEQYLYAMAYGTFCPGPAHILRPEHPNYSDNTYEQYKNAFPPEYMNIPVMGAWVPVEYRPDDIVVMRRNPYYWKVDEAGNQLPYLNEMHYRLSTWADRDVQAVAGSGDFSNLEQAESFVEALKRSAEDTAPARLQFGARTIGYTLEMNLSANGWGEPDDRAQSVRELNRNLDFRKAISIAVDRQRLGDSLVRGPFTAIYPGGLYAGTAYYDKASTTYYPYNLEAAGELLDGLGLTDTDGNGIRNFPEGGDDVEITLLANTDYGTDTSLAEGVIAMMEPLGLRVIANFQQGTARDDMQESGQFDWHVRRQGSELVSVVQGTAALAPTGPRTSYFHRAGTDGSVDLLPFEAELVDTVNAFINTSDAAERAELMKTYQKLYTENVYTVGLTQYPGALIINKRFANIPAGAPIFMFNWAEDNIIRERVYVPEDKQGDHELHPETLPGAPGSDGAM
ncbi:ABC transporter substrate-binding protein [Devosia sp. J2-20]|jgi:peptide/nickel transport system substrate-binding protein|uniref:ABC transporter substrate-binding protein n=1 Tax=Devosia litorisediminis TaxID=2829817 RepID=A0A942E8W4_9HYPH|nr:MULTISPECIES: ABC transporter substrate-binding protein [Devosia]MBS3847500.1 ABC transporter substrate-binding protein [Devosia litorisediminis]MCZ4347139.1 ABC transporter substrate-binding protein [Devosia neptuniae]WDQ99380.1 ABC transporter substrate-binding protein [Devosia sp. J2-20]